MVLWQQEALALRQLLVTSLVCIWGTRLAVHIWIRNRGKGEDKRYAQWRMQWGDHWLIRSFLQVFMLQGVLLLVVVLPGAVREHLRRSAPRMARRVWRRVMAVRVLLGVGG